MCISVSTCNSLCVSTCNSLCGCQHVIVCVSLSGIFHHTLYTFGTVLGCWSLKTGAQSFSTVSTPKTPNQGVRGDHDKIKEDLTSWYLSYSGCVIDNTRPVVVF